MYNFHRIWIETLIFYAVLCFNFLCIFMLFTWILSNEIELSRYTKPYFPFNVVFYNHAITLVVHMTFPLVKQRAYKCSRLIITVTGFNRGIATGGSFTVAIVLFDRRLKTCGIWPLQTWAEGCWAQSWSALLIVSPDNVGIEARLDAVLAFHLEVTQEHFLLSSAHFRLLHLFL